MARSTVSCSFSMTSNEFVTRGEQSVAGSAGEYCPPVPILPTGLSVEWLQLPIPLPPDRKREQITFGKRRKPPNQHKKHVFIRQFPVDPAVSCSPFWYPAAQPVTPQSLARRPTEGHNRAAATCVGTRAFLNPVLVVAGSISSFLAQNSIIYVCAHALCLELRQYGRRVKLHRGAPRC